MLRKEKSDFRRNIRRWGQAAICVLFIILTATMLSVITQPASGETVELRLLVIDGWMEKNPLPGIQVELIWGQEKLNWTTDSQGRIVADIPVEMLDYQTEFLLFHPEKRLRANHSLRDGSIPYDRNPNDPIEQTWAVVSEVEVVTGKVVDRFDNPVAGAKVCCTLNSPIYPAVTDEEGNFELEVDSTHNYRDYVFAFKPGAGSGAVVFDRRGGDNFLDQMKRQQEWSQGPFKIKLWEKTPVSFHVVDMDGNPIEGVSVGPTALRITGSGLNGGTSAKEYFAQKTDRNGNVVFDWIPTSNYGGTFFEISGTDPRFDKESKANQYGTARAYWDVNENNLFEIQLPKKVRVDGSIRLADGSVPSGERFVIVTGSQSSYVQAPKPSLFDKQGETIFSTFVRTNLQGDFTFYANAGSIVSVCPNDMQGNYHNFGVAPMRIRVAVGDGSEPAPRFDFVLRKGTRFYGTISEPKNDVVIEGTDGTKYSYSTPSRTLAIHEVSGPDDIIDRYNQRVYNSGGWSSPPSPNTNGNFDVQLPPGLYRLKHGNNLLPELLEITDQEEIHRDF